MNINLKLLSLYFVIPEFFCRESSDFCMHRDTGSPTKAFEDDENRHGDI